jgi:hypothetical protein
MNQIERERERERMKEGKEDFRKKLVQRGAAAWEVRLKIGGLILNN